MKRKKYQYVVVLRPCALHPSPKHASGAARRVTIVRSKKRDRYFFTKYEAMESLAEECVRFPCCTTKVFRVERVL